MLRGEIIKGVTLANIIAPTLALTVNPVIAADTVQAESSIPTYAKTSGISGNINSVGSDTMNNLMTLWCEGFTKD